MTEVLFYHLERSPLPEVLPSLLERGLARGWQAIVKVRNEAALEDIDAHLWTYHDESFLPHGRGDPHEAHPIWLTMGDDLPRTREILFVVEGADLPLEDISHLVRIVYLFDAKRAEPARKVWKAVKAQGLEATYWKQSPQGRWEKAG
ncbi:MAG: DNA polymerase III subunit chi [Pseudomonadota bacterium]